VGKQAVFDRKEAPQTQRQLNTAVGDKKHFQENIMLSLQVEDICNELLSDR
jgi:hypothetical protein